MVARGLRKPIVTNVLSQSEIQNIQEERREYEQTLKESEGYGQGTGRQIDSGAIRNQIKRLEAAEHQGQAPKLSGSRRDDMAKRATQLEEKFQGGMPTRYEMDHPARCPGAVKKHMKWLANNQNTGEIEEYRQIQRTLNPGEERSVEELRRDK